MLNDGFIIVKRKRSHYKQVFGVSKNKRVEYRQVVKQQSTKNDNTSVASTSKQPTKVSNMLNTSNTFVALNEIDDSTMNNVKSSGDTNSPTVGHSFTLNSKDFVFW